MKKKKTIKESIGVGAGYSMSRFSGSRGGMGGGSNLGQSNSMYTYEIKPLNHTLEQIPNGVEGQETKIQIGTKIRGFLIPSNSHPQKTKIEGIVKKLVKTDNEMIKYYLVLNLDNMEIVKVDPLTVEMIDVEPHEDTFSNQKPWSRRQRMAENQIVPESLEQLNESKNKRNKGV